MSEAKPLLVLTYLLAIDGDGAPWATLERCTRRRSAQPDRWAVRTPWGGCLNKDAVFEYEPSNSGRTDEFLARARFDTPEQATEVWLRHYAQERMQSEYDIRGIRLV